MHSAVNRKVAGSTPAGTDIYFYKSVLHSDKRSSSLVVERRAYRFIYADDTRKSWVQPPPGPFFLLKRAFSQTIVLSLVQFSLLVHSGYRSKNTSTET